MKMYWRASAFHSLILFSILATGCATSASSTAARDTAAVSFYEVPLVCGAAPHIGCGTRAKPVLLALEARKEVSEAWLNRPGTIMAVVWDTSASQSKRNRIVTSIVQENNMAANEVTGDEYDALLTGFPHHINWHRGANVDRLSEEEAEVVADRVVNRVNEKTPLNSQKAHALRNGIAEILEEVFTRTYSSDINSNENEAAREFMEELGDKLFALGRRLLNDAELQAYEETLTIGMSPN